jgi:hypothetical protein
MKNEASTTISTKKIALLHVAKRELDLCDDDYSHILNCYGFVNSTADLDQTGFENVMRYLTACGFRSEWTKRTFGERRGMATPAQVEKIRDLWAQYHGHDEKEAALNAWLSKYHGVSALRFVCRKRAQAALIALKSMTIRPKLRR